MEQNPGQIVGEPGWRSARRENQRLRPWCGRKTDAGC